MKRLSLLAALAAALLLSQWNGTEGRAQGSHEVLIVGPPTPKAPKKVKSDGACHGGCSLAKHDVPELSEEEFLEARAAYASDPATEDGEALSTLLFHNQKTRAFLKKHGPGALSPIHQLFLERELRRTHASVEIRLVEPEGRVRVATGPMVVPLGIKQHLHPTLNQVQDLEFNGTIVRTGLYHLWNRY